MPRPHLLVRRRAVSLVAALVCTLCLIGFPALARPVPTDGLAESAGGPPADSPAARPPGGPVRPVPGAVLRPFDPPAHPYGPGHRGVDLAAAPGDAVHTVLAGEVAFAGPVARVGWVTVDHGGGLATTYGPVDPTVTAGQRLDAGDRLATLSDDAAHLDWGARLHGSYIDPLDLLVRWSLRLTAVPA